MSQDPREETEVLRAVQLLEGLQGKVFDALSLGRPKSIDHAATLGRVIGKLSPIVSDLLEYEFVASLNLTRTWLPGSRWIRQDPGFPDIALRSGETVHAGIEIKTWFPFATEITGRFRETQSRLAVGETRLMVVAWLPEFLLHGGPRILGIWVDKAINVAKTRDSKYHKPPRYLVVDLHDVLMRTSNLPETSCAGYFFQGSEAELAKATTEIMSWSSNLALASPEYQGKLREIVRKYPYGLDSNFAKIERIEHKPLQDFKTEVLSTRLHGRTVGEWRDGICVGAPNILQEITRLGHPDARAGSNR